MDCGKVGALIGRLRRERGLTQRELAGRLLVSDKAPGLYSSVQSLTGLGASPGARGIWMYRSPLWRRSWGWTWRPCCPESCRRPENREEI